MKKLYATNDKTKYALVDNDIYEIIQDMKLKFCADKDGYFRSTTEIKLQGMNKKKCLLLHRLVWLLKTGELPELSIDHIDIDPANNQFSNLRLATRQEQNQHQRKKITNTSGFIGVFHLHHVDKRRKKNNVHDYWKAQIHKPDRQLEQKCFPYTKNGLQHAAMWRDDRVREYFRDFAGELNFPTPSNRQ